MTIGDFKELVKLRLSFFNITDYNEKQLDYLIIKGLNSINNITNQNYTVKTFPKSILEIWVDRAVGEYLYMLMSTNSLPEDFDFSAAVTQIKEGDTSVSYGDKSGSSPIDILKSIINYLLTGRISELVRYRRLAV